MKNSAGLGTIAATLVAAVLLADCGGGSYGGGGNGTSGAYTVGGTVTGLAASGMLVLQNNGGDNLTITMNGDFTFATAAPYLSSYHVTVLTQPANQSCTVTNGTGPVGLSNITNIAVGCA